MVKKAICFLCKEANKVIFSFAEQLKNDNYDIFICIDDNTCIIPKYNVKNITVIQFHDNECERNGFMGSVIYALDRACSRDKALYYFCKKNIKYDYVWFLEDDVFIPNKDTIKNLDNIYTTGDLISANNYIKLHKDDNTNYWQHWFRNDNKIKFPWAHSMICAIRVSKELLHFILDFATSNKRLLFDELLFNTIALQNNLNIINPQELSNIIFSFEDIDIAKNINPLYLYHPVKQFTKHEQFRKHINI